MSSRKAPAQWGGALRGDTKNGCVVACVAGAKRGGGGGEGEREKGRERLP